MHACLRAAACQTHRARTLHCALTRMPCRCGGRGCAARRASADAAQQPAARQGRGARALRVHQGAQGQGHERCVQARSNSQPDHRPCMLVAWLLQAGCVILCMRVLHVAWPLQGAQPTHVAVHTHPEACMHAPPPLSPHACLPAPAPASVRSGCLGAVHRDRQRRWWRQGARPVTRSRTSPPADPQLPACPCLCPCTPCDRSGLLPWLLCTAIRIVQSVLLPTASAFLIA